MKRTLQAGVGHKVMMLYFVLILILGCLGQGDPEPEDEAVSELDEAKKSPEPYETVQLQSTFEDEYARLSQTIERKDPEAAKEHYDNLYSVYQSAKEDVGEEHVRFMVDEDLLTMLKGQIAAGSFDSANSTLSNIGGNCGISVCHLRGGGNMANLEFEYGIIKSSLDKGDIETAKEHYPAFENQFYESKGYVSKFLPEIARERMKDEYVNELNDSLYSEDLERSRNAISVISNNTCSLSGCHRIFF